MNGHENDRFRPRRFNPRKLRPQSQPQRPQPRPQPKQRASGPATVAPKAPKNNRERRRMLKATLHRLSRLVGVQCAILVKTDRDTLFNLIQTRLGNRRYSGAGEAIRLAKKIVRLRLWSNEQKAAQGH